MALLNRWTPWLRTEVWNRYQQGLTFQRICAGLPISFSTVWQHVKQHGGFAPRERQRRASALTQREREEISRGLAVGCSYRALASQLGRSPSTISREVSRNGGRHSYRAVAAEQRAWQQAGRPQRCKLARSTRLRRWVEKKLEERLSPQQIAAWLRRTFVDDVSMRVSHETIYRTLFIQTRGTLRKDLQKYLRTRRTYRRPRADASTTRSAPVVDGISISERPAEANDRAVPGHWEGDLLMGNQTSAIATLVERTTRFVILVRLVAKDTKTVTAALAKHIRRLPDELRRSLAWDRGSEMSAHKQFAIAADIDVYFCDPHSPWQRGSNENTNGLLRDYFPKGDSVAQYDQRYLNRVARQLNARPRETLGWRSPAEAFNDLLR
jgi:IS30 family transposase